MKYWTKRDLFFLIPAFLLLAGGGWDLQRNWAGTAGIGRNEEIGTVRYKVRVAERLFQGEKLWMPVYQNGPVYNYDTIRTESGSVAVLTLSNGTEIHIDESTMVTVSLLEQGAEVRLENGDLTVKSDKAEGVTVFSGDSALAVSEGSAGFVRKGGVTEVSVDRGRVEWSGAGSKATLTPGADDWKVSESQTPPEPVRRPARIVYPPRKGRIAGPPSGSSVALEWESVSSGSGALRLEVSRNRDFSKPEVNRSVTGSRERVNLEPGLWYWRLLSDDDTPVAESSFTLLADKPPRPSTGIISPVQADPITGQLALAWTPSDQVSGYRVEIARDAGFTDVVNRTETTASTLNLSPELLPPGEYHFRVLALYPMSDTPLTGPAGRVIFGDKKTVPVTVPVIPSLQLTRQGSTDAVRDKRLILSWDARGQGDQFEVTFFNEAGQTVKTETVDSSRLVVPEMPAGTYTWQVRSLAGGEWSKPSEKGTLVIRKPEPPSLRYPAADAVLSGAGKIRFSWNDPENTPVVLLEVDDSERFNSPEIQSEVRGRQWAVDRNDLKPGRWFWRVSVPKSGGSAERVSGIRSFILPLLISKPVLRSPDPGQVVDVYNEAEILFTWDPVPGADSYEVSIIRSLPGMESELHTVTVKEPEYRFTAFEFLTVDRFQWSVVATGREGFQVRRSEPARGRFRIIQSDEPEAVTLEIPGVIYR